MNAIAFLIEHSISCWPCTVYCASIDTNSSYVSQLPLKPISAASHPPPQTFPTSKNPNSHVINDEKNTEIPTAKSLYPHVCHSSLSRQTPLCTAVTQPSGTVIPLRRSGFLMCKHIPFRVPKHCCLLQNSRYIP